MIMTCTNRPCHSMILLSEGFPNSNIELGNSTRWQADIDALISVGSNIGDLVTPTKVHF